jgi:hypothetical protein
VKRTYLALALLGVGVFGALASRGGPSEITVARAYEMTREGEIVRIMERTDQGRIILTTREGDEFQIPWIHDDARRNEFLNDLVHAAPRGVVLGSGSEGQGYRFARDVMSVFWLLYLLIPVTIIDLVLMVRRSGRGWESADVLWLVAMVLLAPVGSLAWLIAGRRVRNREHRRPGPPHIPPPGSPSWRDDPSLVQE